jgi:hypothetical protein
MPPRGRRRRVPTTRQRCDGLRRVKLGNEAAAFAHQHGGGLAVMRVGAGDEGVAALDLVDEAMSLEEIQRAVDGDGGRAGPAAGHPLDDVIGAHRRMTLGHAVQHVAALAGQARAAPLAGALGARQEFGRTMGMIVLGGGEAHFVII